MIIKILDMFCKNTPKQIILFVSDILISRRKLLNFNYINIK